MKKKLKIFFLVIVIACLLLSTMSFATESLTNILSTEITNMVIDSSLDNLYTSDGEEIPEAESINVPDNIEDEVTNPNARTPVQTVSSGDENTSSEVNSEGTDPNIMPINETYDGDTEPAYLDEIIEKDFYLLDNDLTLKQAVNGNVYLMGKNIIVDSPYIMGNVFAFGDNIEIKGTITGSVYAFGDDITINTESVSTVYAFGDKVTLAEGTTIINDFKVFASDLKIDGNVIREITAYVENINVTEKSEYIGKGEISYTDSCVDSKDLLKETTVNKKEKIDVKKQLGNGLEKAEPVLDVLGFLSVVVTTIVVGGFFKNKEITVDAGEIIVTSMKGLIHIIVVPIVCIVLAVSIVALPIGIIGFLLYLIGIYISLSVASVKSSQMIMKSMEKDSGMMTLLIAIAISVCLKLLKSISVVGGWIGFFVLIFGFGTLVNEIFPPKSKKMIKKDDPIIEEN